MSHGPHIQLHLDKDRRPCVTVSDTELHDLIEDFLVEKCDLSFESSLRIDLPNLEDVTTVIESGLSFDRLALNISEIEPWRS